MLNTSNSISILMASAAFLACISNPVLAMEHVNDDQDPGCCVGLKKAVIQSAAKKAENYVLEKVATKAKNKVGEQIDTYCSENFGNGIGSNVLGFSTKLIGGISIGSLKETVRAELEIMRSGKSTTNNDDSTKSLLISKTKIMFEENADKYLKKNAGTVKQLVRPEILKYAEQAGDYVTAGLYGVTSLAVWGLAGYQYAIPVFVSGALDALIMEESACLKPALKYIFGFDKIVDAAETLATRTIDRLDSKTILKFYNTKVTLKDRKNAEEFDELLENTIKTGENVMNKAYTIGSSFYDAYLASTSLYGSLAAKK